MRVVFLGPVAPERTFRRVTEALSGVEVAFGGMAVGDLAADGFLAREAERQLAGALREPAHVVAYSGMAAVTLLVAAREPGRFRTLTLVEPPWIGNDVWGPEEAAFRAQFDALAAAPAERFWAAFAEVFAPGAPEMPRDPMPGEAETQKGLMMRIWQHYKATPLDRTTLARLDAPVLLPYGTASGPRARATAEELASHLPRATLSPVEGCHHFDITFVAHERLTARLTRHWEAA